MAEESPASCANCGKAEELEANLKTCTACKLVKYCDRDCQIAHHFLHKKACKQRAAELHDEALFKQPPKADDCPICFLLLPEMDSGHVFGACCSTTICTGCCHAHYFLQSNGHRTCPFCRAAMPSEKRFITMLMKRVDANDARAIYQLGKLYFFGDECYSITKDIDKAARAWVYRSI
jgi:hypothetical protein